MKMTGQQHQMSTTFSMGAARLKMCHLFSPRTQAWARGVNLVSYRGLCYNISKHRPRRKQMAGGIYLITCTQNGRQYVGSSKDIAYRWRKHREKLSSGRHWNRYLQRAWN